MASGLMSAAFCIGFIFLGVECDELWMQLTAIGLMFFCFGITGLCYRYLNKLERRYRYYVSKSNDFRRYKLDA